jgi:hypothetical protein
VTTMKNSNRSVLLGALAVIAGVGPALPLGQSANRTTTAQEARTTASPSASAVTPQAAVTEAALRRMHGSYTPRRNGYPNGPGWTQAQVQRRARKARNVRRNRLSHR